QAWATICSARTLTLFYGGPNRIVGSTHRNSVKRPEPLYSIPRGHRSVTAFGGKESCRLTNWRNRNDLRIRRTMANALRRTQGPTGAVGGLRVKWTHECGGRRANPRRPS